jgi:triosephosphate isomerase (TIM)
MFTSKKYIIGNWKSNMGINETVKWLDVFSQQIQKNNNIRIENLEIVICPPYISIPKAHDKISELKLPIKLGAQDISSYTNGAYTGEVSGEMLKDLVSYVLVGHSERRQYFNESNELLEGKVEMAKKNNINSVYCVPDNFTYIPQNTAFAAYEPTWAIGTGKSEDPNNAGAIIRAIKEKNKNLVVVYGGSVNEKNIKDFLIVDGIDGVLPGKSSLDPAVFWEMIVNAANI